MITIKEAITKSELTEYIKFPFSLYKDNEFWVPPIIADELESFDKTKNPVHFNQLLGKYSGYLYAHFEVFGSQNAVVENLVFLLSFVLTSKANSELLSVRILSPGKVTLRSSK